MTMPLYGRWEWFPRLLKLGDYFQNSDPDFHSSNILGDFYELVEVPEINGVNYPTPRAKELFSPDPCQHHPKLPRHSR
jgi:hypothetical protein